eukprot:XP_022267178.1 uncharacterized protein LOC111092897 [Canis lupus familiaris]
MPRAVAAGEGSSRRDDGLTGPGRPYPYLVPFSPPEPKPGGPRSQKSQLGKRPPCQAESRAEGLRGNAPGAKSRPLASEGRDGGGGGRLGARQGPHPAAHGHKHVRALRRTLLTYVNIRVTAPSGPASPNGELTQGTWANLGHSLSRPRLFPGRFLLRSCFRPRAFRPGPADGVGAPEGARPPSLRVVKLGQPCRLSGTQPLAPRERSPEKRGTGDRAAVRWGPRRLLQRPVLGRRSHPGWISPPAPRFSPSTEASDTPFLSRGIPSFRPSPRTAPTHHPTTGQRDRDPQAEARSHRPLNSPGPWCSKLFPVLIPVALRTRCWHSCPDHRPARRPH